MKYDLFICHASEDKDDFVRPLAEALESKGLNVWYDEFALSLGDRLMESIDYGLLHSKKGVVVLSPAFFLKEWTIRELGGLVQREMAGEKIILPIWHDVDHKDVLAFSPSLANVVSVSSKKGLRYIVRNIIDAVKFNAVSSVTTASTHKETFLKDYDKQAASHKDIIGVSNVVTARSDGKGATCQLDLSDKTDGRRFLEYSLLHEVSYSKTKKISIFMADVDDLSQINKVHGIAIGDEVLGTVLKLLRKSIAKVTLHYGRCGDDTFFAVLYGYGITKGRKTCDAVREGIALFPWNCIAPNLKATCSFGIARLGAFESVNDSVVRAAIGMNEAKSKGRNIVYEGPKYIGVSSSIDFDDYWS